MNENLDDFMSLGLPSDEYPEYEDNSYYAQEDSYQEEYEQTEPNEVPFLAQYLANKLGSSTIISGDADNPVELNLGDLSDKQLVSVLDYFYKSQYNNALQQYDLDDTEAEMINFFRAGNRDALKSMFSDDTNSYVDYPFKDNDELLTWKLQQEYPELSPLELIFELQAAKDSPTYESKISSAKKYWEDYNNYQYNQQQAVQEQEYNESLEQEKYYVSELTNSVESIHGIPVPNEVKETVLDLILNSPNEYTPESKFAHTYLNNPEGLVEAATAIAIMPYVADYINELHEEIQQLKKQTNKQPAVVARSTPKQRPIDDDSIDLTYLFNR